MMKSATIEQAVEKLKSGMRAAEYNTYRFIGNYDLDSDRATFPLHYQEAKAILLALSEIKDEKCPECYGLMGHWGKCSKGRPISSTPAEPIIIEGMEE